MKKLKNKDLFNHYESEVPNDTWDRISNTLHKKRKKRRLVIFLFLSLLFSIVSYPTILFYNSSSKTINHDNIIHPKIVKDDDSNQPNFKDKKTTKKKNLKPLTYPNKNMQDEQIVLKTQRININTHKTNANNNIQDNSGGLIITHKNSIQKKSIEKNIDFTTLPNILNTIEKVDTIVFFDSSEIDIDTINLHTKNENDLELKESSKNENDLELKESTKNAKLFEIDINASYNLFNNNLNLLKELSSFKSNFKNTYTLTFALHFKLKNKLQIGVGFQKTSLSIETYKVPIGIYNPNSLYENIIYQDINQSVNTIEDSLHIASVITQNLQYDGGFVSFKYPLVEKNKFSIHPELSISTLLLKKNEILFSNQNNNAKLGKANNLYENIISPAFGLQFQYNMNENLQIYINPEAQLFITPFSDNKSNLYLYNIGVGLLYKF